MAGVENGDWSVAGTTPGSAEDWTVTTEYRGEEVAAFDEDGISIGHEGWELTWLADFTALILATAEFEQNGPDPGEEDLFEDFEAGWPSFAPYMWDLSAAEAALFDGGTQGFEDFENNWTGVPSAAPTWDDAIFHDEDPGEPDQPREPFKGYPWALGFLGAPIPAMFDAGANAFENFEGVWTPMTTL